MNKPHYLKVENHIDYNKVKKFCNENNINLEVRTELFSFAAEKAIEIIGQEDNLDLKNLFSKAEDADYEYDIVCEHVENSIISVLDNNFKDIKDAFYERLELRGLYKKGE